MSKKKRILTFCDYYLPGYKAGGPIRTIANMVDLLSDDYDFYIVTSDRDALDTQPFSHLTNAQEWQKVGKAKVLYLSPKSKTFKNLAGIIKETPHDVLYLNSFFSYEFSIKPLLLKRMRIIPNKPTVLAVRGEFSKGALGLKFFKKKLFLLVSRLMGMHRGLRWQASSTHEKEDILREFKYATNNVYVARNLPNVASVFKESRFSQREPREPLKIVFLSRISPMKNIQYAIKVLAQVNVPVEFDVYGPIRDTSYWKKCLGLADLLPKHVSFSYKGSVAHDQVLSTLSKYDLFFLPTLGENFGHVILESISAGTPALISNKTPWLDLEDNNVGWSLDLLSQKLFVEKITYSHSMSVGEQKAVYKSCIDYSRKHLLNENDIIDNKLLFKF